MSAQKDKKCLKSIERKYYKASTKHKPASSLLFNIEERTCFKGMHLSTFSILCKLFDIGGLEGCLALKKLATNIKNKNISTWA